MQNFLAQLGEGTEILMILSIILFAGFIMKEQMEYGFGFCDILKISDNEIQFVSGKEA